MKRYTPKEAAVILGYSIETLRHWRRGKKIWEPGLGPRFFSIHGRIFYTEASLSDFIRLHVAERDFPDTMT